MGNSPAGARLGGGDPSSDAAVDPGDVCLLEVEVRSQLGLPLTLVRETFNAGAATMVQVPKAISSAATVRVHGPLPGGYAVYACSVQFRQAAPKEVAIQGKDPATVMKSKITDLRDVRSEQALAVVASCSRSSWLRGGEVSLSSFGAAFGNFDTVEAAVKAAEDATGGVENGLCSWELPARASASQPCRAVLDLRRPEGSRRSALLAGGGAAAVGAPDSSPSSPSQPPAAAAAPPPAAPPAPAAAAAAPPAAPPRAAAAQRPRPDDRRVAALGALAQAPRPDSRAGAPLEPRPAGSQAAAAGAPPPLGSPPAPPAADAVAARAPAAARPADSQPAAPGAPAAGMVEAGAVAALSLESAAAAPGAPQGGRAAAQGPPWREEAADRGGDAGSCGPAALAPDAHPDLLDIAAPSSPPLEAARSGEEGGPPAAKAPRTTKSGAVAVAAAAAALEEARRREAEAERRRQEELAKELAKQEEAWLRQSQDQEFQQSLLMDELKELLSRQKALAAEAAVLQPDMEAAEASARNAAQRLERFGENPRLAEELARSEARLQEARARHDEIAEELLSLEEPIRHRNGLLAAMLAA